MTDLLGRTYQPGEDIVTEGEVGDCMYVIQQGSRYRALPRSGYRRHGSRTDH